jgi:sec-independent protein translocase protein TatA
MPGWIGPWELAILLVVVLLIFGPKRLPEMGKSLGKGMREFKDSITGNHDEKDENDDKVALPPAAVAASDTAARDRERDSVS